MPDLVPDLSARDAWHLFETHLAVADSRPGKRYKDWLFGRSTDEADLPKAVVGGAVLLMRDIVREHLRREYSASDCLSMNARVKRDERGTLTVEDLLPGSVDPSDEVAAKELRDMANREAKEFVKRLSERERVVLFAKEQGLSLTHDAVSGAARSGKTTLHETYHAVLRRAADSVSGKYAGEDRESVRTLVLMLLQEVGQLIRDWGASDDAPAHLKSPAEVR